MKLLLAFCCVLVTLNCRASLADSSSDTVDKLFALIADPNSTLDDVKASLAQNPVAVDAIYNLETPAVWALRHRKNDIFYYFYGKMGSPSVNATSDKFIISIYQAAVLNADWPTILDLRKKGGHLKSKQDEFVLAAGQNTVDVIEKYLAEGANVNKRSSAGELALVNAAPFNSMDVLTVLLNAGANVNLKDSSGYTALLNFMSTKPDADKYNLLIRAGADIHARSNSGDTVLSLAARYWPTTLLKSLMAQGLDINAGSTTALMGASEYGSFDTVKFLIENGAKINAKDKSEKGQTALHYATFSECHVDVVNALISAGAEVNAVESDDKTPMMIAAAISCPQINAALIAAGAEVNLGDNQGATALDAAVCQRSGPDGEEIVQGLLAAGADITKADNNGLTPYKWARKCRAPKDIVELVRGRVH